VIFALSVKGLLVSASPAFLASPPLFSALCALAVLPGLAYAWILRRAKPAPLLRLKATPFALFALTHLSVQLSGSPASPLAAAYALLLFEVAAFNSLALALGVAALAS